MVVAVAVVVCSLSETYFSYPTSLQLDGFSACSYFAVLLFLIHQNREEVLNDMGNHMVVMKGENRPKGREVQWVHKPSKRKLHFSRSCNFSDPPASTQEAFRGGTEGRLPVFWQCSEPNIKIIPRV